MKDGWGLERHNSYVDLESAIRRYNSMVLLVKIRVAVQMVTGCDLSGLLRPNNKCSKTWWPVINILREKRPEVRIPNEDSFHEHPDSKNCLELMPVFYYQDNVVKRAVNLK